jgi:hypothetical protein
VANGGQFVDLDIASASLPAVAADFDLEPLHQPILEDFFSFLLRKKNNHNKKLPVSTVRW